MAADYPGLVTIWATLTPGTTTAKLTQLNAMTVTGSVPTVFNVTGLQLFGCLDWTEFATLTAAQQTQLLSVCAMAGNLPGGSTSFVGKMFVAFYAGKLAGPTIAALTALAQATVTPWWAAHGFTQPIGTADLQIAGGLT